MLFRSVGRCMTIKQALRKLKLTKYVENTNYLEYIINRKQLLFIPKLLEDKLIRYFKQIDRTFDSLYTNQSFMSYSYVIYKLLQTMGEHELMSHIQLLKTKTRIFFRIGWADKKRQCFTRYYVRK